MFPIVRYSEISNCQRIVWKNGTKVATIVDPDGNLYFMSSTKDSENAQNGMPVGNVTLPVGWVRSSLILNETMDLLPDPSNSTEGNKPTVEENLAFGDYSCGYALIQDAAGNIYHRVKTTTGNTNLISQLHLIYNGDTQPTVQPFSGDDNDSDDPDQIYKFILSAILFIIAAAFLLVFGYAVMFKTNFLINVNDFNILDGEIEEL